MPTFEVEIGGKVHEVQSDKALSDEDLGALAATSAATPAAKKEPNTGMSLGTESNPFALARNAAQVGKGFWKSMSSAGAAVAQMLEKPIAAGVNAVTGQQTMSGTASTRANSAVQEALGPVDPPLQAAGSAAASLLPLKAAGALAGGAGTVAGRMAQAGGVGGATAMAAQPADEGKDFTTEKAKQFGMGAATAGALQGAGEGAGKLVDASKRAFYGTPGAEQKRLFERAKELGFSIRPSQVREDSSRVLQPGLGAAEEVKNKLVSNKLASAATGEEAQAITPAYRAERHKDLGAQYDQVYAPGTKMKVDLSAIQALEDYSSYEAKMGHPWMTAKAKSAADKITGEFNAMNAGGANITAMRVDSADIQRLRNELSAARRGTNDAIDRRGIGDVLDEIDASVARNHPKLAKKLDELRPKYRSLVTLDEAAKRGIVDPQGNVSLADLGRYLRSKGEKGHPMQELGELGESFGIRGIGQGRVTSGKGLTSGDSTDSIPVNKSGITRAVLAHVGRVVPRGMHDAYVRQGTRSGASLGSASQGAVLSGQMDPIPMRDNYKKSREEKKAALLKDATE